MNNIGAFIPKDAAVEAVRWDGKNMYIRESVFAVLARRNVTFRYESVSGKIVICDKKGNEHSLIDGHIVFDGVDTAFTMTPEAFKEYYVRMEEPF